MPATFNSDVDITIGFGFGSGPFGSPSWTDVTKYARSFSTRRGKAPTSDTFQSGTAMIELDNRDGRFDPNNTSSPYDPDVTLGVPARIQATYDGTTYTLFYGHITDWGLDYPQLGKDATVKVKCVENLRLVAGYDLIDQTFSSQLTSARITALLVLVGWPVGQRNLDTGIVTILASDLTGQSESMLTHAQKVTQAEQGHLFVAANGDITFYNRIHFSGSPASTGTFGPGNLEYADVKVAYDDDLLINHATINSKYEADSASISAFGSRYYTGSNDLITDQQAENVTEWIVFRNKDVYARVTGMTLLPQANPTSMWDAALDLDLMDAITIEVDPPGGGTDLSQLSVVQSIQHDVKLERWKTTVTCKPLSTLETTDFWVMGTSQLGTSTVLA